jgi:Cu+-exporting ATPase
VAASAGIGDVRAALSPSQKVEAIAAMRASGEIVAMVGDGINDAAALAAADVGLAMASGSDIAGAAADITIVRDDLGAVADAIELARATLAKVRQNLAFAFGYNVLGIPLAAFGLLDPMIAGAAMAASSLSVVANALLLRRFAPSGARRPDLDEET